MTVRELLSRMDAREFAEWMAYDALDPIGEERADLRSGQIAALIANVHRAKGSEPFSPYDFMPYSERPRPSRATVAAKLRAFMTSLASKKDKA